ncbi:MAG: 50S ribosomal protein L25 [Candidatus Levybacteria bacterium]|nr:50S ribosomal protein L25 [Candidatus Levybacteria bacterium]
MKHAVLKADARQITGKKVKKLRKEGFLPANVYGKDLKSVAIQVNLKEFQAIFKEVGETGLIDLQVNGETRPVLVKNLQLQYPSHMPLHADFYQVNLKEKVKAMVPVEVTGEAKAVTDKIGILLQQLSEVEVEALPNDLPENITVEVTNLATIGDQITIEQLQIPQGVTVLTDPGQIVVKIDEPVQEEPEEVVAEEGAEAAEGEAAAEGEEGEAKEEGGEDSKETKETEGTNETHSTNSGQAKGEKPSEDEKQ